MEFADGWHDNIPNEEYHSSRAISSSLLRKALDGRIWGIADDAPTDAMTRGTMLHAAILEPEAFAQYAIKPDGMSFANAEGKAWKAAHEGRPITNAKDHAIAVLLQQRVRQWVQTQAIPRGITGWGASQAERSYFWTEGGQQYRIRPDLMLASGAVPVCVSLKSTTARELRWWHTKTETKGDAIGLDVQEAHYDVGLEHACGVRPIIIHLVVTTDTCDVRGFVLGQDVLDRGRVLRASALEIIRRGTWEPQPMVELHVSRWADKTPEHVDAI